MTNVIAMADSSGWAARKAAGDQHEQRVYAALRQRGWLVSEWGLGVLAAPVRAVLQTTDNPLRREPDIIAVRGDHLAAIDCKGTVTGGPHYNINRRSLDCLRRFAANNDLPTYCVFDDLQVLTPDEVMIAARVARLATAGAYLRVPRGTGRPFDAVFGTRSGVAAIRRRAA